MQCPNIENNMGYKFLFALLLTAAVLPAQAKMYKWVDAQGNVHYTDTLPPTAAAQGNAELSKTGNVVKKTESAEDRQKRLAAEAEAAARKKAADEQARKDRALLATFTSEQEIDLARDRSLERHKLVIKGAKVRLKQIEPDMDQLEGRVKAASQNGRPVPAHLQQQYDSKLAEVDENKRIIKSNEEAMAEVRARYEAEKQRFRELSPKQ